MLDTKVPGLRQIIGTTPSSAPTWYSPSVERLSQEHLHLSLCRHLQETQQVEKCADCWLGSLVTSEHKILVRHKINEHWSKWYFSLLDFPNSCGLVWPAQEIVTRGGTFYIPEPTTPQDVSECHLPIVDLEFVQAIPFEWRCPLWVAKQVGAHPNKMPFSGVAACPVAEADSLLRVAARAAFWQMGHSVLLLLSSYLGLRWGKKSLYEVLAALVQHVLATSREETVRILSVRLGADATDNYVGELLEMDDAFQLVDPDDRKAAENERDRQRTARAEVSAFKAAWSAERALVVQATESATGAGGKRAKAKAKALPRRRIPDGSLAQADLRPLLPPSGSIWKCNTGGGAGKPT